MSLCLYSIKTFHLMQQFNVYLGNIRDSSTKQWSPKVFQKFHYVLLLGNPPVLLTTASTEFEVSAGCCCSKISFSIEKYWQKDPFCLGSSRLLRFFQRLESTSSGFLFVVFCPGLSRGAFCAPLETNIFRFSIR